MVPTLCAAQTHTRNYEETSRALWSTHRTALFLQVDLTRNPRTNSLQTLLNTWVEGSVSPVHRHASYAESFVVLEGAFAFWTWPPGDLAARSECRESRCLN